MKYVIISQPRCGTSMMVNTLNSINDVNFYGELFVNNIDLTPHPQEIQRQMISRIIENNYYRSKKSVKGFLDDIYSREGSVGFKLLSLNLTKNIKDDIIRYIQSNNIVKIILHRRNKLKQFISGQTNKKEGKVKINPITAINAISVLIEDEKKLHDVFCNGNYFKKSYESLTGNIDLKEIDLSWIDERFGIVPVPLRKYRPNRVSDNLSNWKEFVGYIEKHKPEYLKWID